MSRAQDLVERLSGVGTLALGERRYERVPYAITRHQGMASAGLPIPGLHRIDGELQLPDTPDAAELVGRDCVLTLEDGRALRITVIDDGGRVLTVGHGPSRCACC